MKKLTPLQQGQPAVYSDAGLEIYAGNPLIEALPRIQSGDEARVSLRRKPRLLPEDRAKPPHIRLHLVEELKRVFIPMAVHETIERTISTLLRDSYVARNPLPDAKYWHTARLQAPLIDAADDNDADLESAGRGFMILGGSGNGKTTCVRRVLRRYPQHVIHTSYKGEACHLHQIVWLRLEAPENCSLQELISTFFEEVDKVVGTNYYQSHGGSGKLPPRVTIPRIPAIIAAHAIGIIVFDELQNLKPNRSGGHLMILNFLMKLINVTQVPVVTIGTFQAAKVLCEEFRLLRRITAGGGLIWDRMSYGATWKTFVTQMWRHQCLQSKTAYSDRFAAILYWWTQGIADYAVSTFQEVQRMAIASGGDEAITEALLIAAAEKQTRSVRAVMTALRDGNPKLCAIMNDVFMVDMDRFISTFSTYSQGGAPMEMPVVVTSKTACDELVADLGDSIAGTCPPKAAGKSDSVNAAVPEQKSLGDSGAKPKNGNSSKEAEKPKSEKPDTASDDSAKLASDFGALETDLRDPLVDLAI